MKHKPIAFEITHFGTNYVIPQRGKAGSIGYDLTLPEDVLVPAHSRIAIPLNIAINLPYGIEAKNRAKKRAFVEGHGRVRNTRSPQSSLRDNTILLENYFRKDVLGL